MARDDVVKEAVRVFGNEAKASTWLSRKTKRFNGQAPDELLGTESGRQVVLDELAKIDHGFCA